MNDERWILAQLKRRLLKKGEAINAEKDYWPTWIEEIFRLIAEIEAEAVLGAPTEKDLPWAESEEVE